MKALSQDHKDLGVVYTPQILVEYICTTAIHTYLLKHLNRELKTDLALEWNKLRIEDLSSKTHRVILKLLEEITIIDPAVGSGYFLKTSFTVLLKLHESLIKLGIQKKAIGQIRLEIVTKNLIGVDISKKAIELCREMLISLVSKGESSINLYELNTKLKLHIKKGNSLIGNTFTEEHPPTDEQLSEFNWDREFPSILKAGGFAVCLGNPPWNILKPLEKEYFSKYNSHLTKYRLDKQEAKKIIEDLKSNRTIREDWDKFESKIKKQSEYYRKTYRYQSGLIQVGNSTRRVSGDINLYKLFLERAIVLMQNDGVCGIVVPSGIHSDAGTKGLRGLIFDENEVTSLYSFENRQGIFPSIHKSFKFDILIFQKNHRKTMNFQAVFMQRDPEFLRKGQAEILSVSWEKIKRFSPSALSIIEFKTELDMRIVDKMYQHPTIVESTPGFSTIEFSRELDVTIDNQLFNTEGKGLPVFEGKMIEQFTHQFKPARYWIDEQNLTSKFSKNYSEYKNARIGFRAIAASTNRRTMIATFIPANSCCSNSIIFVKNKDKTNRQIIKQNDLLYLLGVMNSFVFDYLLRLKVSQNLNMFFLRDMPLPRINNDNSNYREITSLVRAIYKEIPEICNDLVTGDEGSIDLSYSEKLAMLDARIAIIYDLTYIELEYILDQFHVRDKRKESNLVKQKSKILFFFKRIQI